MHEQRLKKLCKLDLELLELFFALDYLMVSLIARPPVVNLVNTFYDYGTPF